MPQVRIGFTFQGKKTQEKTVQVVRDKPQFLIKWRDEGPEHNIWYSLDDLQHCMDPPDSLSIKIDKAKSLRAISEILTGILDTMRYHGRSV